MLQKGLSIVGLLKTDRKTEAQGRLRARQPVAVIDIGSNSIRLVLFEGTTRAPAILFNEKIMCGLGRGVAKTGSLDPEATERALVAIRRYAHLARQSRVSGIHVLATAAAREADNGPAFVAEVSRICQTDVQLLSGRQEAKYARLGVLSGFDRPDGIAGDMGGGSMELTQVVAENADGVTTSLGGLRLQTDHEGDVAKARKVARKILKDVKIGWPGEGRTFYAIGGTWRSLARLHMFEKKYPLDVVHEYTVPADEFIRFCTKVMKADLSSHPGSDVISSNRIGLVPYGAAVMAETLQLLGAEQVTMSTTGLRDGYMYSLLDEEGQQQDALLEATAEIALLRSRSPRHCQELSEWTENAFKTLGWEETREMQRFRIAACNLADIAWRSSMDYRAEQTLGFINNAGFNALSHQGRAYLSIVNFHRYQGLGPKKQPPASANLAGDELARHARTLAAIFRVLYLFSASVEGILPKFSLKRGDKGELLFVLPAELEELAGERPRGRVEQLAREVDEEITIAFED
jgi:exopolyphosphatase/guanosine-5'-triphosphate,3'-diphosphate pyrophosphatase